MFHFSLQPLFETFFSVMNILCDTHKNARKHSCKVMITHVQFKWKRLKIFFVTFLNIKFHENPSVVLYRNMQAETTTAIMRSFQA
jgi:hypothetical protein